MFQADRGKEPPYTLASEKGKGQESFIFVGPIEAKRENNKAKLGRTKAKRGRTKYVLGLWEISMEESGGCWGNRPVELGRCTCH